MHEATQTMQEHVREAFTEWISHSTHFAINPLPLVGGGDMWLWHQSDLGTSCGPSAKDHLSLLTC